MADRVALVFETVCNRLDSHAKAFWKTKHRKQLRLKLEEVRDLLNQDRQPFEFDDKNPSVASRFAELEEIAYGVDELIDDWEQSEKSKCKIEQQVRRILVQLVRVLESFHKLIAGEDEEIPAIPEVGFPGLVTTRFRRVADVMGTVSVQHLPYSSIEVPLLRPGLGHEQGLGLMASEYVGMASTSRDKDESTSAISGHFEVQSERVQGADTTSLALEAVVTASTSESTDKSSYAMLGHLEVQSERVQGAGTSPAQEAVAMASSSGNKDEPTSVVSDHFEVQGERVKASDTTSLSSGYHVPASSSEIVEEDVVPFPPQIGTPPAHESEIQIVSFEAKEKVPSIHKMESEILPSQTEGERKMKCGLNASAQQSVKLAPIAAIELGRSNLVADEPVRSSHLTIKNEIPIKDQLLRESVLYAKKSIKTTVQKIFSHINNVRTTKIAVIGTGGIGKTTVLKALINFLNTEHMFDEVAERLLKVLKGKKFLLLLDDVWEQIDLEAVGIPGPGSENGCKIVIASRKLDACRDMNFFKVVEVKGISWKEARELFYEQVSESIPLSVIKPFADTIVKGCDGLPLLIIVTGRALGEKNDVSIWKDASKKFSLRKTSRECQIEDVLQLLKFSFDQLCDNDVKSCFLHSALFPEAQEGLSYS
ncbi:hypothetical protein Pint_26094 [Pistacia integerrima]|uniref:Uncharacterized protein n=1 Tax=Pistacia integerrima TaxID=434235 RepID=A0ACC0YCL5_9ROSI|nr:hypothetical protein Pint_26094 [Pistacia integerrima]